MELIILNNQLKDLDKNKKNLKKDAVQQLYKIIKEYFVGFQKLGTDPQQL